MKTIIIADDLTGALDTGVQFAAASLRTQVCVDAVIPAQEWERADTQVLCINAGSRHLPPEEAYCIVYDLCVQAKEHGASCVYKKTDSALRGNVGAELSAMRAALSLDSVPFVPSYPALGRVVSKGILYIDGIPFLVVGIMSEDADSSISGMMSGSPDLLIPYTTAMKLNNANVVTSFTVYLAEGWDSDSATEALEAALDAMFSYEEDCYEIMSMSSIEDTMQSMLNMVSALLAGIASIALVVGGIGIMNMMLTTVTERTTEIGLKKALGAIPWQIQMQFLIESFLLSIIGGALGIALGLMLSLILSRVMGTGFVISTFAIALGAGFSAAVGIIFGWAPARKASRLNPIDALRSA